jgi:hypothetical protein
MRGRWHHHLIERVSPGITVGKKPRGKTPIQPKPGVRESNQIYLIDEESRTMAVSRGGFEQCYNVQAAVDADKM